MKFPKYKTYIILATFASILINSCNKTEILSIADTTKNYKKESILKIKGPNSLSTNTPPTAPDEVIIQSQINLNVNVPSNTPESELRDYIEQNILSINGEIIFKVNGVVFYKSIVTNGVENIIIGEPNGYPESGDCSYEGIRQCANKKIYSKGTVSKIVCAFDFWRCYAVEVADCIVENCLSQGQAPIEIEIINDQDGNESGGPSNPTYSPKLPGVGLDDFQYADNIDRVVSIVGGHEPALMTKIYFNQNNNQYYYDSALTCLLPNGFYRRPDSYTVYKITNGKYAEEQDVTPPCVNCPTPVLPPMNNPFTGCAVPDPQPN